MKRLFPSLLAGVVAVGAAAILFACGGEETATMAGPRGTVDVEVPPDVAFDPAEWTTNTGYTPIGDPRAQRDQPDRVLTLPFERGSFPPTFRTDGPNSNLAELSRIHGLIFESLIGIHPETEEFIPSLASHWKVETDLEGGFQTFWFRIDERARWANGKPVTAADVYYSWWHRVQDDRNDPSNVITFGEGFEEPEIVDRLTIKVRTKTLNWRLFLYFGGMSIYPAEEVHIDGKTYLEEYNWKFMTGSGPYHLASPGDLVKGESITLTRRTDWWAENEPWARNTYNFGKIRHNVIRDEELRYEKFKKAELDYFRVGRAQRWVEDLPKEEVVQKGWVKMRKVFNKAPQGFAGLAFNMRHPPFDDRRVRLAVAHLFNRELLIEKLFFNQYELINSIFPGRDWGAGDENEVVHFDPDRAAELLAEAGYRERDRDGFLVGPDGKRLSLTLEYEVPSFERIWLVVKEDMEAAGIEFNLKQIDPATLIRKVTDRQFTIHFQAWTGLLFPNPETSWRSDFADKPANNNIVGFKNARVDELCREYNVEFDRAKQKEITREIDRIVFDQVPYAFAWYAQYHRILFWDRFGYPDTIVSRIGQDPVDAIISLWWWDAEREKAMEDARAAGRAIPQGEIELHPWDSEQPG